jgi:hypothetical protein
MGSRFGGGWGHRGFERGMDRDGDRDRGGERL